MRTTRGFPRAAFAPAVALAVAAALAGPAAVADEGEDAWFGIVLGHAPGPGVAVLYPVEGGPAEAAGIVAGDRIVRIGEEAIGTADDLGAVLARHAPGDELSVVVRRGPAERTVGLRLGRRGARAVAPAPAPARPYEVLPAVPGFRLGFTAAEMTAELRRHYGAPEDRGVLITGVEPETPAAKLGLAVGDVVTDVGARPVESPAELQRRLALRHLTEPVEVRIVRGREARVLALEPGALAPPPALAAPSPPTAWVLGTPGR